MANPLDITNVLCLIIAVISIIGNSVVCHIIIRTKSMKTVMNYLLLNLALLDVITGFIAIFKVIFEGDSNVFGTSNLLEQVYNKSAITAEVFCKVGASFFIGTAVTPALLMAMAYERYMAVVNPLTRRADGVTKVRLKWILAVCWLSGIAILVVDVLSTSYQEGTCELVKLHWFDIKVYTVFVAILHYVIPSLVIFVFYFRVIKTLRSTEGLGVQGAARRARNKARRNVVFIVITVAVIFYVLSGIPHVVYFLFEVFGIKRSWVSSTSFLVLLFTMNSVSNPVIYFTFMKAFRDRLMKIIFKGKKDLSEGNLIIINEISLKRHNTSTYRNYNLDNGLENEPKLLRISECSVTMQAN